MATRKAPTRPRRSMAHHLARETTVSSLMSVTTLPTLAGRRSASQRARAWRRSPARFAACRRRGTSTGSRANHRRPRCGLARATLDRGPAPRRRGGAAQHVPPRDARDGVRRALQDVAPDRNCGSPPCSRTPTPKRPPEDAVADAVVTHVARDRRRRALRLSGAAAWLAAAAAARPPASAIFDLHTLWPRLRLIGPAPSVIARTQFGPLLGHGCPAARAARPTRSYSSLDPRLADRCRVGAATASYYSRIPCGPSTAGTPTAQGGTRRPERWSAAAVGIQLERSWKHASSDEISERTRPAWTARRRTAARRSRGSHRAGPPAPLAGRALAACTLPSLARRPRGADVFVDSSRSRRDGVPRVKRRRSIDGPWSTRSRSCRARTLATRPRHRPSLPRGGGGALTWQHLSTPSPSPVVRRAASSRSLRAG